jgi:hypothetical protein
LWILVGGISLPRDASNPLGPSAADCLETVKQPASPRELGCKECQPDEDDEQAWAWQDQHQAAG